MMKDFLEYSHYLALEDGAEIYYEDVGSGIPIVLVPGLSFSTEMFSHQIEYFSKHYRVIAIDPRSQGRSTKTTYGNHYLAHGKDLNTLINALDLHDIVLLGWSTGNLALWSYVQQFGTQRLKAAITVDMSPKPMSDEENAWVECNFEELAEVSTGLLISQQGQRDFMYDYAENVMVQRKLEKQELEKIVEISCNTPFHIMHTLFVNAVLCDMREGAKKAEQEIPTLMFIAEHWSTVAEPYMNNHYPKTKTIVMGGHLMFWEYPEVFNKQLEDFIKAL